MSDTGQPVDSAAQRKRALRERALAARRNLPDQVRAAAALRVQAALRELLGLLGPAEASGRAGPAGTPGQAERAGPAVAVAGRAVAGYVPIGAEPGGPDLPAVLAAALPPGSRVLLPVLCPDRSLDWVAYQPGRAGGSATSPPGRRLGVAAVGDATLVVVPALAVDRRGVRLGRGGGSYDRALAHASPHARVVALLHDGELLDEELPAEPHDRRVSAVVTPGLGLVPVGDPAGGPVGGPAGGPAAGPAG